MSHVSETLSNCQSYWSRSCWAWWFHNSFCFSNESGNAPCSALEKLSLKAYLYCFMPFKACVSLLSNTVFAAVVVEVHRWFWCWLEQRGQREHVWYDCWRFSIIKQMDCTHLGTMCMEVFSTMQGCIAIFLWLWKGKEWSNFLIIFILYYLVLFSSHSFHWLWCLISVLIWYRHCGAALPFFFYLYKIIYYSCQRAILTLQFVFIVVLILPVTFPHQT